MLLTRGKVDKKESILIKTDSLCPYLDIFPPFETMF